MSVLHENKAVSTTSEPQKNIILVDWFSFTSRINSADEIKSVLGLSYPGVNWLEINGCHGFKDRYYFNGISIHYNGSEKMGLQDLVWVEFSGQGCRAFEEFSRGCSWDELFNAIIFENEDYHLTRLDIAYDDWEGVLDLPRMRKELDHHNVVTSFRKTPIEYDPQGSDLTIYFGSKKSDMLFRCYNKAAERNRSDELDHWIRFEIQLRDDHAFEFLKKYIECSSLGKVFCGVVSNSVRFVIPSEDSNKSRWKTRKWWSAFIGSAEKISLYTKKDTDYNLYKLENYVINNCGNAVSCYIDIVGEDQFKDKLKHRECRPNVKYDELKNRTAIIEQAFADAKDVDEARAILASKGIIF